MPTIRRKIRAKGLVIYPRAVYIRDSERVKGNPYIKWRQKYREADREKKALLRGMIDAVAGERDAARKAAYRGVKQRLRTIDNYYT